MTAAVVVLAVALAAALGAIVAIVLVGRGLLDRATAADERARVSSEEQIKQKSAMFDAVNARDKAVIGEAQAKADTDALRAQLARTQKLANVAAANIVADLKEKVVTADEQQLLDMAQAQLEAR